MSNCMHHSRFQCNRLLAIFLASFLATLMLTMLVYSTSAAQGDNGNNAGKDIILLIDNSGSMILGTPGGDDPTDPDELRIRISRFIINLLNHLGAPDVRVGAITFAQASTVRVPLTPVEEWTEEDLNAIVGEHEGQVTEFAEALNAAQQMLLGPDGAIDPDREIEIWLLTDADLNESLAGTVDIYISQLRDIVNTSYTEKTTIRILSFEDDNVDNWNTIFSDVSSAYFSLLDHTLEETFHYVLTSTAGVRAADYTSVSVSGTHHINQPVQPYQNWVRFTILPENPVTTSFTLDDHYLEPYVSGHNYFFPQPDRGDWQVHLQSSEPSIVFYQFVADPSPFFIYPELVEVQAINQPLEVRAVLANSVIGEIQPGPDFEVSATLTSGNNQILTPLQPGPGFYSATIPIDQLSPGVYSLVVEVQGRDDFSNFTAYDDTRTVHLVEPPQIGEIEMESTTSDEPLEVTVPVSGWQTLLEQKITLELKDGTGATITSTEAAGTRGTFHWNPPAQSAGVYEIIASIAPSNLPLPYLATSEHQLFTISDSGVTSVPKNYQFTVGEVSLAPEQPRENEPFQVHISTTVSAGITNTKAQAAIYDAGGHLITTTQLVAHEGGFSGDIGPLPCATPWYYPSCGQYTLLVKAQGDIINDSGDSQTIIQGSNKEVALSIPVQRLLFWLPVVLATAVGAVFIISNAWAFGTDLNNATRSSGSLHMGFTETRKMRQKVREIRHTIKEAGEALAEFEELKNRGPDDFVERPREEKTVEEKRKELLQKLMEHFEEIKGQAEELNRLSAAKAEKVWGVALITEIITATRDNIEYSIPMIADLASSGGAGAATNLKRILQLVPEKETYILDRLFAPHDPHGVSMAVLKDVVAMLADNNSDSQLKERLKWHIKLADETSQADLGRTLGEFSEKLREHSKHASDKSIRHIARFLKQLSTSHHKCMSDLDGLHDELSPWEPSLHKLRHLQGFQNIIRIVGKVDELRGVTLMIREQEWEREKSELNREGYAYWERALAHLIENALRAEKVKSMKLVTLEWSNCDPVKPSSKSKYYDGWIYFTPLRNSDGSISPGFEKAILESFQVDFVEESPGGGACPTSEFKAFKGEGLEIQIQLSGLQKNGATADPILLTNVKAPTLSSPGSESLNEWFPVPFRVVVKAEEQEKDQPCLIKSEYMSKSCPVKNGCLAIRVTTRNARGLCESNSLYIPITVGTR